jgi:protein-S-isoprenylcysteine O-methyltransferase Ste14
VPAVLLALFSHHVYPEDSAWDTLLGSTGLLLLVVAMGGRIWASAHLVGRKNQTLVTEGPYAMVRNPLYLFSLVGFIGAGLAFESLFLGGIFAAIFFISHWPEIRAEEKRLKELFGDDYQRYQQRVPCMIPALGFPSGRKRESGTLTVDAQRFMGALRDCLAIPLVIVVADLLEWAKIADLIPVLVHLP